MMKPEFRIIAWPHDYVVLPEETDELDEDSFAEDAYVNEIIAAIERERETAGDA